MSPDFFSGGEQHRPPLEEKGVGGGMPVALVRVLFGARAFLGQLGTAKFLHSLSFPRWPLGPGQWFKVGRDKQSAKSPNTQSGEAATKIPGSSRSVVPTKPHTT